MLSDSFSQTKPDQKDRELGEPGLAAGAGPLRQPDPQTGERAGPHRAGVSYIRPAAGFYSLYLFRSRVSNTRPACQVRPVAQTCSALKMIVIFYYF